MAKNEAETRYELIDPILRDKGYRVPYIRLETPAPVEPTGAKAIQQKLDRLDDAFIFGRAARKLGHSPLGK